MNTEINDELCIGCGLCADICPDVFVMEENKAKVKASSIPSNSEECCGKAKEDCPVEAIGIE